MKNSIFSLYPAGIVAAIAIALIATLTTWAFWSCGALDSLHQLLVWRQGFSRLAGINQASTLLVMFAAAAIASVGLIAYEARRAFMFVVAALALFYTASVVASYQFARDFNFTFIGLAILVAVVLTQAWRVRGFDNKLTRDIEACAQNVLHAAGDTLAAQPLDAGLRLLHAMLKCDEAIIYRLDDTGAFTQAARFNARDFQSPNAATLKASNSNHHSSHEAQKAWRENIQLCEHAARTRALTIHHHDTNETHAVAFDNALDEQTAERADNASLNENRLPDESAPDLTPNNTGEFFSANDVITIKDESEAAVAHTGEVSNQNQSLLLAPEFLSLEMRDFFNSLPPAELEKLFASTDAAPPHSAFALKAHANVASSSEQLNAPSNLSASSAATDTHHFAPREMSPCSIALPLCYGDKVCGVLLVRSAYKFDKRDAPVLETVGEQLAHNLQQAIAKRDSHRHRLPAFLSSCAARTRLSKFSLIENQLSLSAFTSHALDAASDGYAVATLDGRIAYINRALRGFADIDAASAAKLDLFALLDCFRCDVFDEPMLAVQKVLQTAAPYERELHFAASNRTLAVGLQLVTASTSRAGVLHKANTHYDAPRCIVVTARDVSRVKEHLRLKSDMVSLMSHELRTPITSINGFSEMLSADEGLSADSREFAGIIKAESQRLSRMIDNFLAVTRLEFGDKQGGAKVPILIAQLVEETLVQMQPAARAKRIRLSVNCATKIPPVVADKSLIGQALRNIVDNAIRYSPEKTAVTIYVELEAEAIRLSVEDRGYGIPSEALDRVWEKFYRVVRAGETKDEESTGLGLSFVKEVIEQHGGNVQVASQLGRGSRFSFTLPRL